MADDIVRSICKAFDVPVCLITCTSRPRFHRVRWAFRRITGYQGEARRD